MVHYMCRQVVGKDGSDFFTFDSLMDCVRRELKRGPSVITHTELMALWCGLDVNGDNMIRRDEVAGFFKLGQRKASSSRMAQPMMRVAHKPGQVVGSSERHGMAPMPSDTTAKMLESLRIDGCSLPDEDELNSFATQLTRWIEQWRYEHRMPASTSWCQLFKEVDSNDSNIITFDELQTCVRRELKKGPRTISHTDLKALWCSLDRNCNNQLKREEMAARHMWIDDFILCIS